MNIWQKLFWSVAALGALSALMDVVTHPIRTIGTLVTFGVIAFVILRAIKASNL